MQNLPSSYADCLLQHKDGTQRVGRLNNKRDCWLLSSYQSCKAQYAWGLDEVVKWQEVNFNEEGTMSGKDTMKMLARAALLAQKIREESYDTDAYEAERARMKERYPTDPYAESYVDASEYYRKDMHQATEEACIQTGMPKDIAYPLYLSMSWWNDIQDWACRMLGEEAKQYTITEEVDDKVK